MKGIALILFGILLMGFSIVNPWVPILGDLGDITVWIGLICGIIGLVLALKDNRKD